MSRLDKFTCFLFDNGSFRADSTLSLRGLAQRLAAESGMPVVPVSLLHSTRVAPEALHGIPAELLEPTLLNFAAHGHARALLLPLFFGPSAALTEYVPERLASITAKYPQLDVKLADCLVSLRDDSASRVAHALAKRVRQVQTEFPSDNSTRAWVIATDHGSPQRAVTEVRNRIGSELGRILGHEVARVAVASMEKREGPDYAFNDPLLAEALTEALAAGAEHIVVAQQFLQAGRHAGEGGDIAEICALAQRQAPHVTIQRTSVLVDSPEISHLLMRRLEEALKASSWTPPTQFPLRSG